MAEPGDGAFARHPSIEEYGVVDGFGGGFPSCRHGENPVPLYLLLGFAVNSYWDHVLALQWTLYS